MVTRRVTINADTGEVIQDLKISHAMANEKVLHQPLPMGQCNARTILYHVDPTAEENAATIENEGTSQRVP